MLFRLSDVGVMFETSSGKIFPIRHINASFPHHGLIAIKGKSGSGKSTLLNVMSSLLTPSEGKVIFEGRVLNRLSPAKLSLWRLNNVGIVFQHYNLIEGMSCYENISLPMKMKGSRKKEIASKVTSLLKEVGMEGQKDKGVTLLSGGERQRIALARALANSPKIVLADEPTGALDSENGHSVMKILKKISEERLVIYVSHNEEMIKAYSDSVYSLENGRLIMEKQSISDEELEGEEEKDKKAKSNWTSYFTSKHFLDHKAKNIICFLSGLIGYSSLLLSVGFYAGSGACIENEETRSLEYMQATVSEKTYIGIENSPLTMVKRKRPTLESAKDAIEGIDGLMVAPDYSFFLPQYSGFELDGDKKEGASFLPCIDLGLNSYEDDFLVAGTKANNESSGEVLVNEEFVSAYGDCIGRQICFSNHYSFSYGGVREEGKIDYSFLVKGVVSEFSFLNSPKVYYSYIGVDHLLASTYLDNGCSIKEAVENGRDEETFTSLDYLIFAKTKRSVPLLHARLEELKEKGSFLAIESSCYEIKNAFTSLTDAFSMALIVFVFIAIVGVSLIEGMSGYSNLVSSKKEAAILLSLGASKNQIDSIYINESVTVSLLSAIVSLALAPLLSEVLNWFIQDNFSLRGLINIPFSSFLGVPYFLFVLLFFFAMIVAYLGTAIAIKSIKEKQLAVELKDE